MSVCRTISDQALETLSCEAMAAAKRARTDVVNFTDLSLEKFQFKDLQKMKTGTPSFVVLHEGFGVTFNLTPSGWLSTKYGFDTTCAFGRQPSFLGGPVIENDYPEGLAMRFALNDETTAFLREIDEKASEEYKKFHTVEWQPLLTEDTLFGSSAAVKIHVGLKGKDLSKLTIVQKEKVDRGEGWDFLKEYMGGCNDFRNAEVKVCLRFKKIWHLTTDKAGVATEKAGLKLAATRIVLRAAAVPDEVDPFGDDAELLA